MELNKFLQEVQAKICRRRQVANDLRMVLSSLRNKELQAIQVDIKT